MLSKGFAVEGPLNETKSKTRPDESHATHKNKDILEALVTTKGSWDDTLK